MTPVALAVTRRAAIAHHACKEGRDWSAAWLSGHGGDDNTPIPLAAVLDSPGGVNWALWTLRCAAPEANRNRVARLFAADCAERVVVFTGDPRPAQAIAVARRHAVGDATAKELAAARAAAVAASASAWHVASDSIRNRAARNAVLDAASAADAAWATTWTTTWDAAWAAARVAAWAVEDTDWDAARDAELAWQADRLRLYLTDTRAGGVQPADDERGRDMDAALDYHIAAADAGRSNLERVADLMRGLAHDIEDGQDRFAVAGELIRIADRVEDWVSGRVPQGARLVNVPRLRPVHAQWPDGFTPAEWEDQS